MTKTSPKEIFKKGIIILSGISFFWFSASEVINMITKPQTPIANTQEENLSPEAILRKEMKGYELVLAKEPDNVFALEKLVEIHLQLRNLSTALPLVEKLVTIQPDNQRYQEVLKIIKQGLAQEKTKTPPPPNSSNIPDNNEKK